MQRPEQSPDPEKCSSENNLLPVSKKAESLKNMPDFTSSWLPGLTAVLEEKRGA